jgi:hypothetical protein
VTLARDLTTPRPHRAYRACYYCGVWCRGLTCRNCQDLLALDPHTAKGTHAITTEGRGDVTPDSSRDPQRR